MSTRHQIGRLLERLTLQTDDPEVFDLDSLTRSGTTATATTKKAHGFASNDWVTIAGAVETDYNGRVQITVPSTTTFTYTVSGSPDTPATGAVTAVYLSDAQGGREAVWRDVAEVPAELMPLRATERLQLQALQSQTEYRFRIRTRTDVVATMRALWTPRWPPLSAQKTLQVLGVLPIDDGRRWLQLEAGVVG